MPNRIIKESITTSETLAKLSGDEERHFWRLIVQADDFGYLDARPEVLRAKGYAMMLDSVSLEAVESYTQVLVKVGLLHLFPHNGKRLGHFPTWLQHQQKRAKFSKFPQVPSCESTCTQLISSDITCKQVLASAPETLIRDINSRSETLEARVEKPPKKPRVTEITPEFIEAMKVKWSTLSDLDARITEALAHKSANNSTDKRAYLNGWLRRDTERISKGGTYNNGRGRGQLPNPSEYAEVKDAASW